jgi:S1-C subfamily serine protease
MKQINNIIVSTILLLIIINISTSAKTSKNIDIIEKIQELKDTTVEIITYNIKNEEVTYGSGFFIAKNQIVTCSHVIENNKFVTVKLNYNITVKTSNIKHFKDFDISLITLDYFDNQFAKMANSSTLKEGQEVYTISNPQRLKNTVTKGILSNINRGLNGSDQEFFQFDAAISNGSSGGLIFNNQGEAIGIINAGNESGQNLNYAIPINNLKKILKF